MAISIRNLTKRYGDFPALNNVTFDVPEGEFFGFLGANGAGKTTTINILCGLATPTSGSAAVFGSDVLKDYRQARRLIGLVPQEFNFDRFFSLEEILTYYSRFFGLSGRQARERAEELLRAFDLYEKRKDDIMRISGGMKRRLLIARALVHRPKILILDEPTAGADVELRRDIWDYLRRLNRQGTTILLTTHYIEEAERLAKRIGIIHQGQIIALNTKEKLMSDLHKHNYDLTLDRPLEAVPAPLEKKYAATMIDENKIRIVCSQSDRKNSILADVRKAGLRVVKTDISASTLEDMFIELTGIRNGKRNRILGAL